MLESVKLVDLTRIIRSIAPEYTDLLSDLSLGSSLQNDTGLDSLALMTLIFSCEEAFNIRLSEDLVELASLQSIGDLLIMINKKKALNREGATS